MQSLLGAPPARLTPVLPADRGPAGSVDGVLETIRARGVLRVLVLPDRMPYAFANRDHQLVGMDVELAQALATDLGVHVEFFEVEYDTLPDILNTGTCDIAMSGVVITPERAAGLLFSVPYVDETLAFVMRDHLRDRFRTWSGIRELGAAPVGVPDVPAFVRVVSARAPQLQITPLRATEELFKADDGLMAYVLPAERGSVMTLLHPAYSVVVPQPDTIKLPLAYPVARRDERWLTFVNTWLELKRRDGTLDALYRHWILGQDAAPERPRWSVVRNVLGWVK
jgi:ABC-type amino acid transport substrate-binding protein